MREDPSDDKKQDPSNCDNSHKFIFSEDRWFQATTLEPREALQWTFFKLLEQILTWDVKHHRRGGGVRRKAAVKVVVGRSPCGIAARQR
jgi:hypothetical protein